MQSCLTEWNPLSSWCEIDFKKDAFTFLSPLKTLRQGAFVKNLILKTDEKVWPEFQPVISLWITTSLLSFLPSQSTTEKRPLVPKAGSGTTSHPASGPATKNGTVSTAASKTTSSVRTAASTRTTTTTTAAKKPLGTSSLDDIIQLLHVGIFLIDSYTVFLTMFVSASKTESIKPGEEKKSTTVRTSTGITKCLHFVLINYGHIFMTSHILIHKNNKWYQSIFFKMTVEIIRSDLNTPHFYCYVFTPAFGLNILILYLQHLKSCIPLFYLFSYILMSYISWIL